MESADASRLITWNTPSGVRSSSSYSDHAARIDAIARRFVEYGWSGDASLQAAATLIGAMSVDNSISAAADPIRESLDTIAQRLLAIPSP
jgi:hypothetical protein